MYDSLLHMVSYLVLLLASCAMPKKLGWKKLAAVGICAANVAATLPWVFAEMTDSGAKWPKTVSNVVWGATIIFALLFLFKELKKKASDKKASDADGDKQKESTDGQSD